MKKLISCACSLFILLLCCACGNSAPQPAGSDSNTENSSHEEHYIAYCYSCDRGITDDETYSSLYIDGREEYMCSSCLDKNKGSASDYDEIEVPGDGLYDDGYIHVNIIGEGETVPVTNSWITEITYYPVSNHLIMSVDDKDYVFANVDDETWEAFKAAPSKGEFYHSTFKGATQYWVDDYDGTNGDLIIVEWWDTDY